MNLTGLWIGLFTLVAIGVDFLWVIKFEYYFGARPWKAILFLGSIVSIASLFIESFWLSAIIGTIGGSIVWGATELTGQEERARRGLFPVHPKRRGAAK